MGAFLDIKELCVLKEMMLYVLLLEQGKYFVGQTEVGRSVKDMFVLHCVRLDSWMTQYHPLDIIAINSGNDVDQATEDLIREVGIENVRGGRYSSEPLPSLPPLKRSCQIL